EEKDTHIIIFARAYRDGKRKEPIRKQQTENKERRKRSKPEEKPDRLRNTNHRALKNADSANTGEKL
ncbi:hypothetical protein KSU98_12345, partial [Phocaeicola vulgatus]|uniref:hypothetical protein n=1 Tax=Phocaeicola vulgatus TaxID=821 RepID=UPI001C3819F4